MLLIFMLKTREERVEAAHPTPNLLASHVLASTEHQI
jgi:hypothetical protein